MNKKNRTYKDYLLSLLALLNTKEELTIHDTDQVLAEAGYNPAEVGKKFQTIADQSIKQSIHNWRNRAHLEHEQAKATFLEKNKPASSHLSRSELLDAINNLLAQENLKIAPAYRNLSAQTDEDLESMLRQLKYLIAQRAKKSDD
jgi:hypothetical protein